MVTCFLLVFQFRDKSQPIYRVFVNYSDAIDEVDAIISDSDFCERFNLDCIEMLLVTSESSSPLHFYRPVQVEPTEEVRF